MLRNLIAFCLSRRPLVLTAFAAFLGARLRGVHDAQHRGLSRSGAADHRDHRAVAGPVAGGGRALRHDPDRDRGREHARASNIIRSNTVYALGFIRLQFEYGRDYYFVRQQTLNRLKDVDAARPACSR